MTKKKDQFLTSEKIGRPIWETVVSKTMPSCRRQRSSEKGGQRTACLDRRKVRVDDKNVQPHLEKMNRMKTQGSFSLKVGLRHNRNRGGGWVMKRRGRVN